MNSEQQKKRIVVIIGVIALIVLVYALWNAPNSFWQSMGAAFPQDSYENGVRIRTVRGQDYIVTSDGNGGERLTLIPKEQPQE